MLNPLVIHRWRGRWLSSVWCWLPQDFAELGEDSSDDEGPPALEPVGAHIRRAEAAKKAAEAAAAAGLEVGEGGDVDLETKEMSETAFSNKVENMISVCSLPCSMRRCAWCV